jgi:hypothetical protein
MMKGRKLSADPPSAGIESSAHTMSSAKVIHCRRGTGPPNAPLRMPYMNPTTYNTMNATRATQPTITQTRAASDPISVITGYARNTSQTTAISHPNRDHGSLGRSERVPGAAQAAGGAPAAAKAAASLR